MKRLEISVDDMGTIRGLRKDAINNLIFSREKLKEANDAGDTNGDLIWFGYNMAMKKMLGDIKIARRQELINLKYQTIQTLEDNPPLQGDYTMNELTTKE